MMEGNMIPRPTGTEVPARLPPQVGAQQPEIDPQTLQAIIALLSMLMQGDGMPPQGMAPQGMPPQGAPMPAPMPAPQAAPQGAGMAALLGGMGGMPQ